MLQKRRFELGPVAMMRADGADQDTLTGENAIVRLELRNWIPYRFDGLEELKTLGAFETWETHKRMRASIFARLCSRPSEAMREAIAAFRKRVNMSENFPFAGLQMRSMKDRKAQHKAFMSPERQHSIWWCASKLMHSAYLSRTSRRRKIRGNALLSQVVMNDIDNTSSHKMAQAKTPPTIFFTSDEPSMHAVALETFGSDARIIFDAHAFEHTSRIGIDQAERSSRRGDSLVFRRENSTDEAKAAVIPTSIVEWFVLGEADPIVCTGTSFCQSAHMRTYATADVVTLGSVSYASKHETFAICGGTKRHLFATDNETWTIPESGKNDE